MKNSISKIWMGLFVVTAAMIPYLLLGTESIITFHDQLDVEVPVYLYRAKYFFSGKDIILEMMNGVYKSVMTPTAPLVVLFYKFLPAFYAFLLNQWLVMVVGFVGMFLCIKRITANDWIGLIVGVLFAFLPINSVYAFVLAVPLLLYLFWNLYEGQHLLLSYVGIVFFALFSSLVLVGYACISVAIFSFLWLWIREKKAPKHIGLGIVLLTGVYALANLDLILQVFGISGSFVSHKKEILIRDLPFFKTFLTYFAVSGEHMPDFQGYILLLATPLLLFAFIRLKKNALDSFEKNLFYWACLLYGMNFFISLFVALWRFAPIVALRKQLGGIFQYFQADRFYWLLPTLWYLLFAICLALLWNFGKQARKTGYSYFAKGAFLAFLGVLSFSILDNCHFKPNVKKLVDPAFSAMTWSDFYAEDVFAQIDAFIGRDKSDYRVASVGMYPASALYNGFYCLDGYSNNYPLTYKHEFRDIITGELEKDVSLKSYYDDWGSRCYVFSTESPGPYLYRKNSIVYKDFSFNAKAFHDMGGEYLFAVGKIENASSQGLTLLREEPFATQDSYYQIYLYSVTG